jgi:hypothetical protein
LNIGSIIYSLKTNTLGFLAKSPFTLIFTKIDLSYSERGIVIGASRTRCSFSNRRPPGLFTQDSIGFTKNGATNKQPVSGSPVAENTLLMKEVEGECKNHAS